LYLQHSATLKKLKKKSKNKKPVAAFMSSKMCIWKNGVSVTFLGNIKHTTKYIQRNQVNHKRGT